MRLAIADRPYPPYVDRSARGNRTYRRSRATRWYSDDVPTFSGHAYTADHHPAAADWDRAETHQQLLAHLVANYDGWAIATSADGVDAYGELPRGARIMVWVKPRSMPGGNRIMSMWEAVILFAPEQRRSAKAGRHVPDVLIQPAYASGFTGSKPPEWTRWVLDALGYDPETDAVDDLFPGSGAVTRVIDHYQAALPAAPEGASA